jgi:hypothetical protein
MKNRNLKQWAVAIACALTMGLTSQVSALTTSSSQYVGSITPNIPANPGAEVDYINALILLSINTSGSALGQTLVRSGNVLTLPTANLTGAIKDDTSPSTSVDVTGFEYLLGKYDADQAGAYVFYVGNLTGIQTLPGDFNGHSLSHWSLYNAGGTSVPDGGATLALLGLAVTGLGFARRKLS